MYDPEQGPPLPYDKTVTARRTNSQEVRNKMGAYRNLIGLPNAGKARVTALLWVIAWAERNLAMETRSQVGDLHATPARVLAHLNERTR